MKDPVESFIADIAFDDGMGFGLGIGEPKGPAEDARVRLAEYVKQVRRAAPTGAADQEELRFLTSLERRVSAEVGRAKDPRAKDHLAKVVAAVATARERAEARK